MGKHHYGLQELRAGTFGKTQQVNDLVQKFLIHCVPVQFHRQDNILIHICWYGYCKTKMSSDRIGVIVNGNVVQEISPQEIKEQYPNGLEDYFMEITNGGTYNE